MFRVPRDYRHRCGMDVRRRTPLPHRCSGGWAETNTAATSMFQQAARCRQSAARAGAGRRGVMSSESPVPGLELRGHEAW